MKTIVDSFTVGCTGDAVAGDEILFTEAVFGGSYRKPRFLGERRIAARVLKDSYGAAKQQHTFTIEAIASDGYDPLPAGTRTTRKGRNVYRNGTFRRPWAEDRGGEAARQAARADKHARGDNARVARADRRAADEIERPWRY